MKTLNLIFYVFGITLLLSACSPDEIIDKFTDAACKIAIDEINDEYDTLVMDIQNNTNLTEEEKTSQINAVNSDREDEIEDIEADCDDFSF